MKKILAAAVLVLWAWVPSFADPTAVPLGDQFKIGLLSDLSVVGVHNTNDGTDHAALLDGFAQFGHWNGDYLFAIDGGFVDQTQARQTWGIHAHVFKALFGLIQPNVSPSVNTFFNSLMIDPRYSLDDVGNGHKKGVLSLTFGAQLAFN